MYMYTEADTRVFVPAAVCMILNFFIVFKYNIIGRRLYVLWFMSLCVVKGEGYKNYLFKRFFERVNMHNGCKSHIYSDAVVSSSYYKRLMTENVLK